MGSFRLRWKILLITVLPPVFLTAAIVGVVSRGVSSQVDTSARDHLRRSSLLFERLLSSRSQQLRVDAEALAADPRISSLLGIPAAGTDPGLRATVRRVAHDLGEIVAADLFEVYDGHGERIASAGRVVSPGPRSILVDQALAGKVVDGMLTEGSSNAQVVVVPVTSGGKVCGALMLGDGIGQELARDLDRLTRGGVAFTSRGRWIASTFASDERVAVVAALASRAASQADECFPVRTRRGSYIGLVRTLPRSDGDADERYVLLRSIDTETAFLHDTQRRLIELGAVAALIALLAGWLIAERVLRPVTRLVRAAGEIEHGNYEFPIDVRSRDEVGELAESFQSMRRLESAYVSGLNEITRMKGAFISVAEHELRTPTSVIQAYVEMLALGELGPVTRHQREAIAGAELCLRNLNRIAGEATRVAESTPGSDEATDAGPARANASPEITAAESGEHHGSNEHAA